MKGTFQNIVVSFTICLSYADRVGEILLANIFIIFTYSKNFCEHGSINLTSLFLGLNQLIQRISITFKISGTILEIYIYFLQKYDFLTISYGYKKCRSHK